MTLTPAEFQARLEKVSVSDNMVYGRLRLIDEAEAKHETAIQQFRGYQALTSAFKCFVLETFELINTHCRPQIKEPLSDQYPLFVPRLTNAFQTLCGSEKTALSGYPYVGYTVLRNVFDNLILTSGVLQKLTDFYALEGVDPSQGLDIAGLKKKRKQIESKLREALTGKKSGLSEPTLKQLATWDALFDYETHGARLSLAGAMDWMQGRGGLPLVPKFNETEFSMFLNRFNEIAWMLHRLLPALQPPTAPMPGEWGDKWFVINESFEIAVVSLTKQFGKGIGEAMVELVKTKFPFDAKTVFPL